MSNRPPILSLENNMYCTACKGLRSRLMRADDPEATILLISEPGHVCTVICHECCATGLEPIPFSELGILE